MVSNAGEISRDRKNGRLSIARTIHAVADDIHQRRSVECPAWQTGMRPQAIVDAAPLQLLQYFEHRILKFNKR